MIGLPMYKQTYNQHIIVQENQLDESQETSHQLDQSTRCALNRSQMSGKRTNSLFKKQNAAPKDQ